MMKPPVPKWRRRKNRRTGGATPWPVFVASSPQPSGGRTAVGDSGGVWATGRVRAREPRAGDGGRGLNSVADQLPRSAQTAHLARVIRSARQGRFTLSELSRRSGISVGMLSMIETGRGNPSYVSLVKLSRALGVPFSAFYSGDAEPGEPLVKKQARRKLEFLEGATTEVLSTDFKGPQVLVRTTFYAGYRAARPIRYGGQTSLHLWTGALIITLGGRMYRLSPGDTLTWEGGVTIRNPGAEAAEAVVAIAPSPF
jgi:transcriptional regulator with XRE-family HTH domain